MACVLDLGAGSILLWAAVAWLLRSTLERRSWLPRSFSVGTVAGGSNGRNLLLTVLELGSPSPRCLRGWSLVSPMFWPAGGHFVTVFTGWLESGLGTLPRRVWDQVPALTSPFDLTRLCKGLSSSHVGVGQGLTVEMGGDATQLIRVVNTERPLCCDRQWHSPVSSETGSAVARK